MRNDIVLFSVLIVLFSSCKIQTSKTTAPPPPANSILQYLLVNNAQKNNPFKAIFLQKEAIKISPFHNDVVIGNLYIGLGAYYFQNNEFEESKNSLRFGVTLLENLYDSLSNDDFENLYGSFLLIANNNRLLHYYDSALFYTEILKNKVRQYFNGDSFDKINSALSEIYTWEALIYYDVGELEKSISLNIKAISLRKKTMTSGCIIANNYSQLADIYTLRGDFQKALLYQKEANSIILNCFGDSSYYYAEKNTSLGYIYYEARKYTLALNCFEITHNIISSIAPKEDIQYAYSYNNLGDALCGNGLFQDGICHYNSALQIFKDNDFYEEASIVYHNLGNAYFKLGQFGKSKEHYFQALKVGGEVRNINNIYTAYTYQRLGQLYNKQDDLLSAINYYSYSISELSRIRQDSSYYDVIFLKNWILSKPELLKSLYFKGVCELDLYLYNGNKQYLNNSIESLQKALQLLDVVRNQYNNERAKRAINEFASPIFSNYLYALLLAKDRKSGRDNDDKLLEAIERNKYTALRSHLYSSKLSYFYDFPNNIINNIDSLNKRIRIYENYFSNSRVDSNNKEENVNIHDYLFDITFSLDSLNNSIVLDYPKYSQSLFSFSYYTIEEAQGRLKKTDGIIEYFYNDSLLVIIAITKRDYKIHCIRPPQDLLAKKTALIRAVNFSNIKSCIENAKYLYNYLINPIEDIIKNLQNIIIIPDNQFSDLPFELLIKDSVNREYLSFKKQQFLINDFCISYHYSLNLWGDKLALGGLKGDHTWTKEFSGFAPLAFNTGTNINNVNSQGFLPYTKSEINNIAAIFNLSNKISHSYIGDESSEEAIIEDLKTSKIVHIASHSCTDANPENYHIILGQNSKTLNAPMLNNSLIKDIQYSSLYDGKLFLHEIYNLSIKSELVTISACGSGAGKTLSGEGVISIAQGFYYSGAQNIIYTLWDVSDMHTKFFMSKYYHHINMGVSYPEALRKTKLEFIHSKYFLPKLWSGFLIIS